MPENLHEFMLRFKSMFHQRRLDRDMAEELEFHQAMLREKMLRQGVPQAEVDAATRRTFGNAGRWHERLRELWQFRKLENLARDVSFSARLLRKSPGFTAVALLTLALGVGANTTVFSMINGLLLRPLPVPESERLAVFGIDQGGPRRNFSFSAPFFRSLERRHEVFADVFAFNHTTLQVRGRAGNENVQGQLVSGEFFRALRTAPLMGRTLTPEDDRPAGDPAGFAAVISEHFWESWFNRAPDVLGRKLQVDNTVFTVVGVMPKRFIGADPMERPEIFAALATEPILDGAQNMTAVGFHAWWLTVMGRLRPGATLEQANAQLSALTDAILHEGVPDAAWIADHEKRHFQFVTETGSTGFTYIRLLFRKPLVAVFAMCGGILLLACLNLASLLMARGAARERELATRLAMGATRRRLVQQLLVESLLIAVMGTALGLLMAPLVSRSLAAVLLSGQPSMHIDTSLDIRVFGFAALAAIVASVLIGLVPALQATSGNLSDHIKDGQHATQAHERTRIFPRVLMSFEVALALMLVVGAGLLASSLVRLYRSGAGFDPRGVQNILFSMDKQPLKGEALMQFYRDMGEALSHQPGVQNVSFAGIVPFSHDVWDENFSAAAGKDYDIYQNTVGPSYFQTMRIPMLQGRDFGWNDTMPSGLKIILNRAAADLLFPDGNVLGHHVTKHRGKFLVSYEVVGVVGNAKYEDLRSEAPPTGYVPMTQYDEQQWHSYNAVVRIDGPAAPLAGAVRSLAAKMAPDIPAPVTTSMLSVMDDSLSAERMMALLSVFFAVCALVVTAIGLYGTLAYATARRTSEIGIRMALGAQRTQVVGMVLRQNAVVAVSGSVVGLIAAVTTSRALTSFLYGTSAHDPWVLAYSVAALATIASVASLLPALRAARIEPMSAIRCE
jgi:predicted permease